MPGMLIAYDADGNVVATLDYMVATDDDGNTVGLVDFAAHEDAGGEHTAIWNVASDAVEVRGSKVWPEWIGNRAHDFLVELEGEPGRKRIKALVHKTSGHRRERAAVEAAIEATPTVDGVGDIRAVVGGPDRPLALDADGRAYGREVPRPATSRPPLPVARARGAKP